MGTPMFPSPTNPMTAVMSLGTAHLVHDRLGDTERLERGGYSDVDRRLEQHLLNLRLRRAVVECSAYVDGEFVRPVQRGKHRDVDEASRLSGESIVRPHAAPAILRDQFLNRTGELARRAE